MWTGYLALVHQQLASQGKSYVGFLNPTTYGQNYDRSPYATDFHDILTGTRQALGRLGV